MEGSASARSPFVPPAPAAGLGSGDLGDEVEELSSIGGRAGSGGVGGERGRVALSAGRGRAALGAGRGRGALGAGQDMSDLGSQAGEEMAQRKGKRNVQDTVKIFLPLVKLLFELYSEQAT
jgi:hypothetical protein